MDLIRRSQAGDAYAFACLFEQYKNLVYRTALLMLDDAHEAEDALQEVFVKVHRSLDTYQPEKGAITTWLHRITVNYCLNHKRRRWLDLLPLEHVSQKHPGTSERPVEEQFSADEHLGQALNRLSGKLRAAVILRFFWDLSYAEIAQVLEVPLGTVQSRLHQAIQTLRFALSENPGAAAANLDLSNYEE